MNQAEKTFIIVFVFGLVVFVYYFFIIPPTPVFYEFDSTSPPPSNAQMDQETGELIVGYERPSAVFVIPPVIFFYILLMMVTDNGEKQLREIIDIKKTVKDFCYIFWDKIYQGIDEYKKWKNK